MATVATIRALLNNLVRRADGEATPWTDVQANAAINSAFVQIWQDGIGKRGQGTVATSQASDVYTIPLVAGVPIRISRIELERIAGGSSSKIGRVLNWAYFSDTQVRIAPLLPTDATLLLRFFGWVPFLADGSDLPSRLDDAISYKAAAIAYGQESGQLANSQLQQGLDQGRVVDYPTAVGLSAYWERRYRDIIDGDPAFKSFAPRAAHR